MTSCRICDAESHLSLQIPDYEPKLLPSHLHPAFQQQSCFVLVYEDRIPLIIYALPSSLKRKQKEKEKLIEKKQLYRLK